MWESIKSLVTSAKEALGIELPELPVDLGAAGDAATGAAEQLSQSVGGLADGATAASETLTGELAGAAETVTGLPGAAAEAAEMLPDLTNVLPDTDRT